MKIYGELVLVKLLWMVIWTELLIKMGMPDESLMIWKLLVQKAKTYVPQVNPEKKKGKLQIPV